MLSIRRGSDRGRTETAWLHSRHTFSFADYYDRRFMGFRDLRVINEDRVAPGEGFATHPHADMEIVSYVLEGALAHRDSLGNGSEIRPGDVQRLSAGKGIRHSEFNASKGEEVHFLQIWILPDRAGIDPSYAQKSFPKAERSNQLRLVASPDGAEGSVSLHQDVRLFSALLSEGESVTHALAKGRHAWVQVAQGEIALDGERLLAGDGAAVSSQEQIVLRAQAPSEVLVFDLR